MIEKLAEQPTVFDTEQQQLGVVYAKALLAFGKDVGKLDPFVEQLEDVSRVVGEVPGLRAILEAPRIAYDAKAAIIEKAFRGRIEGELLNFLKLVVKRGRFDCLGAISASARDLQDEMAGRVQAILTSAEEVDETTKQNIAQRLSAVLGQQVTLKSVLDPSIIGGFTVRVGDTVYDASIANQLAQVRQKAIQRTSDTIRLAMDRFISG